MNKVLGYTTQFSYNIGDEVHVYTHHENNISLNLYRLGESKEKIKHFKEKVLIKKPFD